MEYSYRSKRVYTTVKSVQDLIFEKSVYTKPKSKNHKLVNDKKEYLHFSPAVANQDKLQKFLKIIFLQRIFLHLVLSIKHEKTAQFSDTRRK